MFTGLVEEQGAIAAIDMAAESARLRITGEIVLSDVVQGASIAVDGCCLTVASLGDGYFEADVMFETLKRTTIGQRKVGERVNLERALAAGARLGGHIVQGHVDAVATIHDRRPGDRWELVEFLIPSELAPYLVEKGSVTVDGISLTVVDVSPPSAEQAWFSVSLIPETLAVTTLGQKKIGDAVNIEVDVMAKYLERMMAFKEKDPS
jgi:riboflavin synthase